mgnify:FL=1
MYYRYGEDEDGKPLGDTHRDDDMLELAADKVPDLMASKHYEGGMTTAAVASNNGFSFAGSRLGCYCSPPPGGPASTSAGPAS